MAKQPLKPAPAASTTSSSGLAHRFITYQNPAPVNITNLVTQIDCTSDNNDKRDQYYCYDFQY